MDRNTAFLLQEGYQFARLHDPDKNPHAIQPDSVVVHGGQGQSTEYCVTSTRITLVGRELPGGPLGEDYGVVCAEDLRSSFFDNTLGGGRVEPFNADYRTERDDDAEESVIDCLLRETNEELGIKLKPEEVILVGLRMITEERSDVHKTINGKVCVDAYFVGFVEERLGAYRAHNGETGDRRVLSPHTLLRKAEQGERKPLPQTQRLAVATAIISTFDLFENALPQPIKEFIMGALPIAREAYKGSQWAKNFIPVM